MTGVRTKKPCGYVLVKCSVVGTQLRVLRSTLTEYMIASSVSLTVGNTMKGGHIAIFRTQLRCASVSSMCVSVWCMCR